jgi:hypothetical protein
MALDRQSQLLQLDVARRETMKVGTMTTAILIRPEIETVRRYVTSDKALEVAVEESALFCTSQTSVHYQCCS